MELFCDRRGISGIGELVPPATLQHDFASLAFLHARADGSGLSLAQGEQEALDFDESDVDLSPYSDAPPEGSWLWIHLLSYHENSHADFAKNSNPPDPPRDVIVEMPDKGECASSWGGELYRTEALDSYSEFGGIVTLPVQSGANFIVHSTIQCNQCKYIVLAFLIFRLLKLSCESTIIRLNW